MGKTTALLSKVPVKTGNILFTMLISLEVNLVKLKRGVRFTPLGKNYLL